MTEEVLRTPVVAERLRLRRRKTARGGVRIRLRPIVTEERLQEMLLREDAVIERVALGHVVETAPEIRREGDVLVIPVLEQRLVVETRLVLKEEVRVRIVRREEPFEATAAVRSTHVEIERFDLTPDAPET